MSVLWKKWQAKTEAEQQRLIQLLGCIQLGGQW